MIIDFKGIKKQNLTKELLLGLIETLYKSFKQKQEQNIIINEYVDDANFDNISGNFKIKLKYPPISINDILIISENGSAIITPKMIISKEGKEIVFKTEKLKNKSVFFVTYKY